MIGSVSSGPPARAPVSPKPSADTGAKPVEAVAVTPQTAKAIGAKLLLDAASSGDAGSADATDSANLTGAAGRSRDSLLARAEQGAGAALATPMRGAEARAGEAYAASNIQQAQGTPGRMPDHILSDIAMMMRRPAPVPVEAAVAAPGRADWPTRALICALIALSVAIVVWVLA